MIQRTISELPFTLSKALSKQKMTECSTCNDNGVVKGVICPACGGKGGGGQHAEMHMISKPNAIR
jgi:DnaJ-class molecular chaperone